MVTATEAVAEDEPVISPGGVDARTGSVRTRRVRSPNRLVFRVRGDNLGVRAHDVLVPLVGGAPCVLIGPEYAGLTFTNFAALRPSEPHVGLWLWAVLTSQRGEQLRRAISVGLTGRVTLTGLAGAPVPVPPPPAAAVYRQLIGVHAAAGVASTSEGRSWWRVTQLPADGQWHRHLATEDPQVLEAGTPLGALAAIVAGRTPSDAFGQPRPGMLPVLNGRSVDGVGVTRWAVPGTGPAADPGDLAVVEVGYRGRVALVDQAAIAGTGVLLVKPHDRAVAAALARYLSSEPAQALRTSLVTGHIPRVTASILKVVPIPADALSAVAEERPSYARPLAELLEQLLWS